MKKSVVFIALALLLGCGVAHTQKKYSVYGVGFYNLENLFDTCHDEGKNDYEYLPDGTNKWTGLKYSHKLKNMARVLSEMGTDKLPGVGCAAIGVSEVENAKCLTDLCNQEPLKAKNFQFVHIEGPDKRGVDCGLLYNPKLFTVRNVKLVPYIYILSPRMLTEPPVDSSLSVVRWLASTLPSSSTTCPHVVLFPSIVRRVAGSCASSRTRSWLKTPM